MQALSVANSAALDGLRGMAALIVVASHSSVLGLHWLPGVSLAGIGKYGVYLFFVISAFLLTLQWLQAPPTRAELRPALGHYFTRRVMRIYPLYLLVLLLGWALPRGLGVPMDGPAVWTHLTLREGRDIYWSVPVEFKYYLVLPLVAWGLAAAWAPGWKLAALVLLVALAMYGFPPGQSALNSIALGVYLPIFLCGSVAAWAWHGGTLASLPEVTRLRPIADVSVLLILVATVPSVLQLLGAPSAPDLLHREFLAWGVFWTAVLLALLKGWLPFWAVLLRQSVLRACGRWCFGIYLLHMPALYLAKLLPVPDLMRGWVGLLVALAVAALAHAWIERPAMRWASRLTRPAAR